MIYGVFKGPVSVTVNKITIIVLTLLEQTNVPVFTVVGG